MARISPLNSAITETAVDDPRLGQLLGSRLGKGDVPRAVLLGFPSDEGVRRNGGRVGAAEGPAAIRSALYRLTADPRLEAFELLLSHTRDLGNIEVSGDLEVDQLQVGEVLTPHIERGTFAVVLGGGHETAYGHFLAYAGAAKQMEILNWDAHPDVRALVEGKGHSGSPFRQAIEHSSRACRRYVVAGLQPHSVARAHLEYVQHHGRAVWREEVTRETIAELYRSLMTPALVSFDLDAVSQAEAPGVSAPNPDGLSTELWLEAAYGAGRSAAVASADVVELSPRHDVDGQTARLAALTVWWLLRGRAERR